MKPIQFNPIYKERVWGGRRLAEKLARELPGGAPIGESWEIVDRAEACSTIASGEYAGKTLRGLLEAFPQDLMGPAYDPGRPFPILVKWLDCAARLSLQVHPPASKADALGGEPKTENWYIVEAEAGAGLLAGLKTGVTPEGFRKALEEQRLEACVHRMEVGAGDSLFVPSGRIHAIDAGNFILEIQQNSDTTYRVYDWGRVGLDGRPRELHVSESLESVDFDDFEPLVRRNEEGDGVLAECEHFRIWRRGLVKGVGALGLSAREEPRLLHVVAGRVFDAVSGLSFEMGANVLIPFCCRVSLETEDRATILVTDRF